MKLKLFERLITGNPLRALIQRHIEGPMLRKMGTKENYPLCLEIGCGRGVGAEVIAGRFGAKKVIATDFDPAQIERAKRHLRPPFMGLRPPFMDKIEFKVENAMALDEPDGRFDAVFSFGVIHHLEDWRKGVKEISRVLKPGGEFFFEEPLRPFTHFFREGSLMGRFASHPSGGEFSFEEFKDELEKASIKIAALRRIDNIAIFGVGRKL